uniref:Protein FAM13A-like isoform X2 n=1 Tax=Petromyzon marinus TaxID=7757 RepID=A0AAJ7SUI0_PETMA|nr:protein FAM13A-like isoform X2 [Petromyzon marinus]
MLLLGDYPSGSVCHKRKHTRKNVHSCNVKEEEFQMVDVSISLTENRKLSPSNKHCPRASRPTQGPEQHRAVARADASSGATESPEEEEENDEADEEVLAPPTRLVAVDMERLVPPRPDVVWETEEHDGPPMEVLQEERMVVAGSDARQLERDSDTCHHSFPVLDFTTMYLHQESDEPITCRSWRGGMEGDGEAHVSWLLSSLMLGDRDASTPPSSQRERSCHSWEEQRFICDIEAPPSPPSLHNFVRRSSSLGSCREEMDEAAMVRLARKIQALKKKIHHFEERFEGERRYMPSHSDKAATPEVLKWMNDLAKSRRQMKELKLQQSVEENVDANTRRRSNTLPKSFGSRGHVDSGCRTCHGKVESAEEAGEELSRKAAENEVMAMTLQSIMERICEKRNEEQRPEDVTAMTREQIAAEKTALQKGLLQFENVHGRLVSKQEKQLLKPLYERYRMVKQLLTRSRNFPIIGSPASLRRHLLLRPIIEGQTTQFSDDIKEDTEDADNVQRGCPDGWTASDTERKNEGGSMEDQGEYMGEEVEEELPERDGDCQGQLFFLRHSEDESDAEGYAPLMEEASGMSSAISNVHSLSLSELLEQLRETKAEKRHLRKTLRDFEDHFYRQNGRNIQKEDRLSMEDEYKEYKQVKAKQRLLEALITKHDACKGV